MTKKVVAAAAAAAVDETITLDPSSSLAILHAADEAACNVQCPALLDSTFDAYAKRN
jgi:hypothetical protein